MKLTMRKSEWLDDWYVIEKDEEPGEHREWDEPTKYGSRFVSSARLSDADCEGTSVEMLDIADAIERREERYHKRCAVTFDGKGFAYFTSPRNTNEAPTPVPLADADGLAALIRQTLTTT